MKKVIAVKPTNVTASVRKKETTRPASLASCRPPFRCSATCPLPASTLTLRSSRTHTYSPAPLTLPRVDTQPFPAASQARPGGDLLHRQRRLSHAISPRLTRCQPVRGLFD